MKMCNAVSRAVKGMGSVSCAADIFNPSASLHTLFCAADKCKSQFDQKSFNRKHKGQTLAGWAMLSYCHCRGFRLTNPHKCCTSAFFIAKN